MGPIRPLLLVLPLLLAPLALAPPARAADGRTEINQAAVAAAGGFPFKITRAGSYVLTSDLDVPLATTGVQIGADDVSLDLNGFAIRGRHVCGPGGCLAAVGRGIEALPLVSDEARRTHVSNGKVQGFGQECLRLGPHASLEGLAVQSCAGSCIFAQEGSLTRGSRIHECGGSAIASNGPGLYADNVIQLVGLAGAAPFASASIKSNRNVCDISRCPGERRRFYLTKTGFQGHHGGNLCTAGFHFASAWELTDVATLEYDKTLGAAQADQGSGPPGALGGWVRSGAFIQAIGNCSAGAFPWTSNDPADRGAALSFLTPSAWDNPADVISPWNYIEGECHIFFPAWCIED